MPDNKLSKQPYTPFSDDDYLRHPKVVKKANDAYFHYASRCFR